MKVIDSETFTLFRVQGFTAGFGYDPVWQTCYTSEDYDETVTEFRKFTGDNQSTKFRLIREVTNVDVLDEKG